MECIIVIPVSKLKILKQYNNMWENDIFPSFFYFILTNDKCFLELMSCHAIVPEH